MLGCLFCGAFCGLEFGMGGEWVFCVCFFVVLLLCVFGGLCFFWGFVVAIVFLVGVVCIVVCVFVFVCCWEVWFWLLKV